jgi:hypothetical protein
MIKSESTAGGLIRYVPRSAAAGAVVLSRYPSLLTSGARWQMLKDRTVRQPVPWSVRIICNLQFSEVGNFRTWNGSDVFPRILRSVFFVGSPKFKDSRQNFLVEAAMVVEAETGYANNPNVRPREVDLGFPVRDRPKI